MANSRQNQLNGLDLSKMYRARVVRNDDPMKEGRLALFVPAIISEYSHGLEEPAPSIGIIPPDLFENSHELSFKLIIDRDDYVWARPASQLVENGSKAKNVGGQWRIPRVGTMVTMYYENADPNRPHWLPFSPTIDGDVIAGTKIGSGRNIGAAAGNWQDVVKRVEIGILQEYDNQNIIYVDNNPDVNCYTIWWKDHVFTMHNGEHSGIVLETEKGHLIHMDDINGTITIKTQTGGASIVMDDKAGTIVGTAKTRIQFTAPIINLN